MLPCLAGLELTEHIGLSPTSCARRVKALEQGGVIDQWITLLNQEALGLGLTAIIHVSMDKHTPERFQVFEAAIAKLANVLECYLIMGQAADYMLKIVVRDMPDYERLRLGKLTPIEGVSGVQRSFALRKVVNKTALPLPKV